MLAILLSLFSAQAERLRHIAHGGAAMPGERSNLIRTVPHLMNIDVDPTLSETMVYPLGYDRPRFVRVGRLSLGACSLRRVFDAWFREGVSIVCNASSSTPTSDSEGSDADSVVVIDGAITDASLEPQRSHPNSGAEGESAVSSTTLVATRVSRTESHNAVGAQHHQHKILLSGDSILSPHCRFVNDGGVVRIEAFPGTITVVNGVQVAQVHLPGNLHDPISPIRRPISSSANDVATVDAGTADAAAAAAAATAVVDDDDTTLAVSSPATTEGGPVVTTVHPDASVAPTIVCDETKAEAAPSDAPQSSQASSEVVAGQDGAFNVPASSTETLVTRATPLEVAATPVRRDHGDSTALPSRVLHAGDRVILGWHVFQFFNPLVRLSMSTWVWDACAMGY